MLGKGELDNTYRALFDADGYDHQRLQAYIKPARGRGAVQAGMREPPPGFTHDSVIE